jgi:hypothetical protein
VTSPYILSTQFDEDTGWETGNVTVDNSLNGTVLAEFITATDAVFEAIPAGLWAGNLYAQSATAAAGTDTAIRIKVAVRNGASTTVLGTSDYVYVASLNTQTAYACNAYVAATNLNSGDRIVLIVEGRRFASGSQSVKLSFGKPSISHVNSTLNAPGGTGVLKVVNGNLQSPASKVGGADFDAVTALYVFAGPNTAGATVTAPSFRPLVAADLPTVSLAKGGTNTDNSSIAKNAVFAGPLAIASGPGNASFRALEDADLPSSISVSKLNGIVAIANGGTGVGGNTSATYPTVGTVFAAAKTGTSQALPSFRALEEVDIPSLAASKIGSGGLAIGRGGTGYDDATPATAPAVNLVFASPASGSAGAPSFRSLVIADLPTGFNAGGVLYRTNPASGTAAIAATAAGTANQYLASSGSAAGNAPTWADVPNDIMGQYPSKPSTATSSAVIMDVIAGRAWTLVQANSRFRCKVAATGSAVTLVLKRKRSGVADATISTITFSTSSLSGSPSTFGNTDVFADDILTLEVTAADSNNVMENIYWTLGGKL